MRYAPRLIMKFVSVNLCISMVPDFVFLLSKDFGSLFYWYFCFYCSIESRKMIFLDCFYAFSPFCLRPVGEK